MNNENRFFISNQPHRANLALNIENSRSYRRYSQILPQYPEAGNKNKILLIKNINQHSSQCRIINNPQVHQINYSPIRRQYFVSNHQNSKSNLSIVNKSSILGVYKQQNTDVYHYQNQSSQKTNICQKKFKQMRNRNFQKQNEQLKIRSQLNDEMSKKNSLKKFQLKSKDNQISLLMANGYVCHQIKGHNKEGQNTSLCEKKDLRFFGNQNQISNDHKQIQCQIKQMENQKIIAVDENNLQLLKKDSNRSSSPNRHSSLKNKRNSLIKVKGKRTSFDPIITVHNQSQITEYQYNSNLINKQSPLPFQPELIQIKKEKKKSSIDTYEELLNSLNDFKQRQKNEIKLVNEISKNSNNVENPKCIEDIIEVDQQFYQVNQFSHIYKCKQKNTGFLFVMKKIFQFTLKNNNLLDSFFHELSLHLKLDHPNIIKLYYAFFHSKLDKQQQNSQPKYYIVYEYGNCSLLNIINSCQFNNQNMPEQVCILYLKDIIQGLKYLHENGIVHRGIDPSNIILVNGMCKINDFSTCAKIHQIKPNCKTTLYSSPQMIQNLPYSYETDNWSLGILAYEMAFGKIKLQPKERLDIQKIIFHIQKQGQSSISFLYRDFLLKLIQRQQVLRLSITQISNHPLFQLSNKLVVCPNYEQ